ncbi:sodium:alanine symporter family protein [Halalkalibacillus sediminis]|uniref:Sodium:alanine symporter family protein n=1 Tax=Halalkalibacillus sediminis TaxID=2018042 RepID=A0A2I0QVR9_9BACI|nr:alanine/glycine:cation symporter family protein [Halalkalibacillus sediminis]PKR78414.1 sodium:alanine symporter family protein [Halalkalibacillus sediminis]
MSAIESFWSEIVGLGNTILWEYLLIYLLLGAGIYFTFFSKFVQFRLFGNMFKVITEEAFEQSGKRGTSAFQAFSISIASRVGTGNLAGVAIAVSLGGPGAVFWMWVVALVGMATAFIESTLAQVYKVPDKDGFRGGPAYYMERALGQKWMGILFSVLITITFGFVFSAVQANTITQAVDDAFGISPWIMGIILVVLVAIIIFGGIKRIAVVSGTIVPIMAAIYIVVALIVFFMNIQEAPRIFGMIFGQAFGLQEAAGGAVGAAILNGVQRGLFSNEAGMGSAPNAAATAGVNHPAKQGLVQSLAVFFDTIVICSLTAFVILLYGDYANSDQNGIQLTQSALDAQLGSWASIFLAITIFLFAFSSVIGNYYYGESNVAFMKNKGIILFVYRLVVLAMVMWGSVAQLQIVWNTADFFMALMAVVNLAAILLLSKLAFAVLKDYTDQKKNGIDPTFHSSNFPTFKNLEWWGDQPSDEKDEKQK